MLMDVNAPIISNYSPISSKGGRRRKRHTKKHSRSNKSRTRNNRKRQSRKYR